MAKHLLVLWAAVCVLAAASTFAVWQNKNTQFHQNDALHQILCFSENAVKVRPNIPPRQRREAVHFYEHALNVAHLKPCP